jgi:hypothetical protein
MERCRTVSEVYGFEVVLKQAICLCPKIEWESRPPGLPGAHQKIPQHHLSCRVCKRVHNRAPVSAASQHLNFSRQAERISVSGSGRSAFFFRPEPPLDYRSWLNQTGISLASGALESWWIRLELNPVAPAILRIEQLAQKKEKAVTYQTGPRQVFRGGGSVR